MTEHILGARAAALRTAIAQQPSLVALDFDGTLAALRSRPSAAALSAKMARVLRDLAFCYPVAIVSGRSVSDLAALVGDIAVVELVGNHGRESSSRAAHPSPRIRRWRRQLRAALPIGCEVVLEDKHHSLSLHWRTARYKPAARAIVRTLCRQLAPPPVVVKGKQVVNLLARAEPNKGTALVRLMRECAATIALYVGDDYTDEDAFAQAPKHNIVGVRVGRSARSYATHHVASQREVLALLTHLTQLRLSPS